MVWLVDLSIASQVIDETDREDEGCNGCVVLDVDVREDLGQLSPPGTDVEETRHGEGAAVERPSAGTRHQEGNHPRHRPQGELSEGLARKGYKGRVQGKDTGKKLLLHCCQLTIIEHTTLTHINSHTHIVSQHRLPH